jgi:hypothetical protein
MQRRSGNNWPTGGKRGRRIKEKQTGRIGEREKRGIREIEIESEIKIERKMEAESGARG